MSDPKTIILIRCRMCNGEYFGNESKLILHPGDETKLPDEVAIIVRNVARCTGCQERIDRTRGGSKRRTKFDNRW